MKKWMIGILCVLLITKSAQAQKQEVQQLLLNVTKLEQFRQILKDLKKGYDILVKGYGIVKDVSEGNFSLHKTFLDALFEISPAVKKYHKIAGIVDMQLTIMKRYKTAYDRFKQSDQFTPDEILYLGRVYGKLTDQSFKNVDALLTVVTAGKLRMSDEERLQTIDAIYAEVFDQLNFLNDFNNRNTLLAVQRQRATNELGAVNRLYHQ